MEWALVVLGILCGVNMALVLKLDSNQTAFSLDCWKLQISLNDKVEEELEELCDKIDRLS